MFYLIDWLIDWKPARTCRPVPVYSWASRWENRKRTDKRWIFRGCSWWLDTRHWALWLLLLSLRTAITSGGHTIDTAFMSLTYFAEYIRFITNCAYNSPRPRLLVFSRHCMSSSLLFLVVKPSHWQYIMEVKNWVKLGEKGDWIFTLNKLDLTFENPNYCVNVYQNRIKIAAI